MADTGSPQGQAYAGLPFPKGTEAYLNAVPVRVIVIGANGHYIVTDQAGVNHQAHHSELAGAVVPDPRWVNTPGAFCVRAATSRDCPFSHNWVDGSPFGLSDHRTVR
jgi:hypothetical protein